MTEFDAFLTTTVTAIARPDPARLKLALTGEAAMRTGREIAARETSCCSLVTSFTATAGGRPVIAVEVPGTQVRCLDVLAAWVTGRMARRAPDCGAGQLTAAARANVQTLRYDERRGIPPEPDRSLGGHQLCPQRSVSVLQMIKTAQWLGLTLDEVAELLGAPHPRAARTEAGLREPARAKLEEVDARQAELPAVRDTRPRRSRRGARICWPAARFRAAQFRSPTPLPVPRRRPR